MKWYVVHKELWIEDLIDLIREGTMVGHYSKANAEAHLAMIIADPDEYAIIGIAL